MPEPSTFTTIVDDARCTMRIEVNRALGMVFLHLSLRRWDTQIAHSLKDGLMVLTGTLRALGIKKVNTIIPEGDDKLYRFQRLYGFTEVRRSDGQILLQKEC